MNLEYRPRHGARSRPLFTFDTSIYSLPRCVTYFTRVWTLTLTLLGQGRPRWPLLDPRSALSWRPTRVAERADGDGGDGHLAAGPSEPAKCSRRPRECSSARWPEGEQGRLRRARECSAGAWGCARAPMGSTARSSRRRRASTCRTSCRSSATAAPSPSWRLERRLLLDDPLRLAQRRHTTW